MKNIRKFSGAVAASILLLVGSIPAPAQQYSIGKTFWSATLTNASTFSTNLASAITLTKYDGFALQIVAGITNPSPNTIDIVWQTSLDGVNWPITNNPAAPGSSGWFSIPLTNSGTVITWTTNITVNNVGYWRINYVTNAAVANMTNVVITGYIKPKRTG